MEGAERREQLVKLLMQSDTPISGSQLSKLLLVSRQIVVQDIALLRASNVEIVSTTKGYMLKRDQPKMKQRVYRVKHDNGQMEEELCIIVDHGGTLLDVQIAHLIYGTITTELVISNRIDVYEFIEQVQSRNTTPLKELTNGEHAHTVEAPSETILDRIEKALREKGFLIE